MNGFDARALLKTRTARAHKDLDAAMEAHALTSADGLRAALMVHARGMAAVWPCANAFAMRALGQALPDYPAMLRADLAWLGMGLGMGLAAAQAPVMDMRLGAGACYVVLGSRLGTAVLRKQGIWRDRAGRTSAYMEDMQGVALWRDMLGWLAALTPDQAEGECLEQGALAAFDHFQHAASGPLCPDGARQDPWEILPA